MSRQLVKYVASLYLQLLLGALGGLLVVYLVADFGDRLKAFIDKPLADVALLYWLKALVALQQLGPAGMLLAAAATVSTLRKRGEWVAMQSLGLSRAAVLGPVLGCSLVAWGALTAFDELVVTQAGTRMDHLLVNTFQSWGDFRFFYFPNQWLRAGPHIFQVRGERDDEGAQHDVTVLELDADFGVTRRLDVERLQSLGGDRWSLWGVEERRFEGPAQLTWAHHDHLELSLAGTAPETFRVQVGRPEYMRAGDLIDQRAIRAAVGLPAGRFELALHNRFAYPMTGVAAALLAMTLALRPNRRGHLTLALVEGLLVAVILFSLLLVTRALALGNHLSAPGAAWGPVLGLAAVSVALWWWQEPGAVWRGRQPSARR